MQVSPYVSDRRKKRKQRRKYIVGMLAIIALYFLLYSFQWFLFRSPLFRVDKIVVKGNNSIESADVVSLIEASALQKHNFFPAMLTFKNMLLWPDQVSQNELNTIPQLQSISISKDYFSHTVTANVSERVPFGIWCYSANESCYWFDNTGMIFQRSLDTQGNIIYAVQDNSQKPQGLNQKVLPDDFVGNFISIVKVLRQSNLGIKGITLTDIALQEVDVQTTNGPKLYFSLRFPADDYLGYIQKLMLDPSFNKLQYIDCRTQDRLYYK